MEMFGRERARPLPGAVIRDSARQERVDAAVEMWRAFLPTAGAYLVERVQDMSLQANRSFASCPDDPAEHQPRWHEYGIVTHSLKTEAALATSVPWCLERWGLGEAVRGALEVEIDGTAKGQLLRVAALLHDVGKFTARTVEVSEAGAVRRFAKHEIESGQIVRGEHPKDGARLVWGVLTGQGFTEAQIEYMAACAERHFELGKLRSEVRRSAPEGYTLSGTTTTQFDLAVREAAVRQGELALEVGVLFLADNLSKGYDGATELTVGDTDRTVDVALAQRYMTLVCAAL